MRRAIVLLLSAALLLGCADVYAEDVGKVSLDNFTIEIDKAEKTSGNVNIRLLAIFPSEEAAARYSFFFQGNSRPKEKLESIYRSLGKDMVVHATVQTGSGEAIFGDKLGAFVANFSAGDAVKQDDGTWRRVLAYEILDYTTDEPGLTFAIALFDVKSDAPFTGDEEQSLYVAFQ